MRQLKVDWNISSVLEFESSLLRFRRYLQKRGYRDSTIKGYIGNVGRYLKFAGKDRPTGQDAARFRDTLHGWKLSRSTLNQYGYAIKAYHLMLGDVIEFTRITPNNYIPHYFTAEDVVKLFSVINNIKHLSMLQVLFYGCLRASELCSLNDDDLDLNSLSIRINNGKGGRDGIACISENCVPVIREYLRIRPPLLINGKQPLFYTDYGNRWRREDLHHMFTRYKKAANINKIGGLHVFSRHTPATIMVANGCDIRIVKEVLRHTDIRTTLRYAHVSDKTKRQKYEQYLTL